MIKKIVCIFVCTLLFATVLTVARPINKEMNEEPVSTGLAKNTTPINIESAKNEPAKYTPFYAVNDDTDYLCYFDPETPGTFNNIAPATPAGFIQNACFAEDIYWVTDQYGNLYTVDLTTGVFTTVGASGVTDAMGLAYDDTTGKMFMTGGTYANGKLYEVDMSTGIATAIGTMGNTGFAMISIICDNDGQLYGVEITSASTPGQFYSIDKTTGAATKIGTGVGFNMNYGQDMEYDKDKDILYFCAFNQGTGAPEFHTIDKTTGLSTYIANLPGQTTGFGIPYILNEPPVTPPAPTGPDSGIINVEYTFTATTSDPESEQIYYLFDWGDGTDSGWVGPYNSGLPGSAIHKWTAAGDYPVKVKAKDVNDAESGFSPSHTITITEPPVLEVGTIKGGLFKVTAIIKNTGGSDATGVAWSIELNGGLIILGKTTNGTIDIPKNGQKTVQSNMILGIGKTLITVKATIPESSDAKSKSAFVIGFLII